jgi:hypothetical protein
MCAITQVTLGPSAVTLSHAESLGNCVSGPRILAMGRADWRQNLRIRWNCTGRLIDLTPILLG